MVWQPYWIYPKTFKIFSRMVGQIWGKLHNYDLVVMWNICFKFQPDKMHGRAARIIEDFKSFILQKTSAAKPCDSCRHSWRSFCSSSISDHTCKVSPQSVQPFRRSIFLKIFMLKKIWRPNHVTVDVIIFSPTQFIPR